MRYPDGSSEEQDEIFETEQEAENYGLEQCSNYSLGGEVLHMSNPGDYPLEDEDADFEIVEING
ncbi:hypothetical protein EYR88_00635 [Arthrobacter sp. S41]|nr:hypothetical protein EYR88_00635 [Arthrobacter sp. S41]